MGGCIVAGRAAAANKAKRGHEAMVWGGGLYQRLVPIRGQSNRRNMLNVVSTVALHRIS